MKSSVKSCFFDNEEIIHQKFAPQGQKFNQDCYISMLKRLREDKRRKRPQKWAEQDWMIRHDDVPVHTALSVQQFLAKTSMIVVPRPSHSPDLDLSDFLLFPNMKSRLKGRWFEDIVETQEESQTVLNSITMVGL